MLEIPENTTDFLYWIKEHTEQSWRQNPRTQVADGYHHEWPAGIKWLGLPELEIDQIEEKFSIKFTPDHREFLKILHTLDRSGIYVTEDNEHREEERASNSPFYNWQTDEEELRLRIAWPYQEILRDVQNGFWVKQWGPEPKSALEKEMVFARQFQQAPPLIPLTSHRFMVSEPLQAGNPVLSVWGADTVIYGWDLKHYLLNEIGHYLDIYHFNEEEQEWYSKSKPTVESINEHSWATCRARRIPFYEDIIQPWNGWPLPDKI